MSLNQAVLLVIFKKQDTIFRLYNMYNFTLVNSNENFELLNLLSNDLNTDYSFYPTFIVNPTKSTYLAIGSLNEEFLSALTLLAAKKSSIEHLGVVLSADFRQAEQETFEKAEKSMKFKAKQIAACIGNVDTFTKISLVRTLIMSKPLHCFRVYVPSKKILDSLWDIFRKSLWSKSFQEKISRRTKVAAGRLTIPVQNGGLGILHVQTTAVVSLCSSFISLISHAVSDKDSILASILHSDPTKHDTAVRFLNSHYFRTFWAIKIGRFFPQSTHLTDHLQTLFDEMEYMDCSCPC